MILFTYFDVFDFFVVLTHKKKRMEKTKSKCFPHLFQTHLFIFSHRLKTKQGRTRKKEGAVKM
jgi:hypothetical protein